MSLRSTKAKVKKWVWWKFHEKFIISLIGQALECLLNNLEELEFVSFKLKGKEYRFDKLKTKELR